MFIRAQNIFAFHLSKLSKFVRKGRTGVIHLRLEGHTQDTDGLVLEFVRMLFFNSSITCFAKPSFTSIAAWPIQKLLLAKAASRIVSLNKQGPAANPGDGKSRFLG